MENVEKKNQGLWNETKRNETKRKITQKFSAMPKKISKIPKILQIQ
jgi:hypothetical protein